MSFLALPEDRCLGVICLGRAGIDLYATEHNANFAEVNSFQRHIGGSPGNIAVALARLGVKTGFIGCFSQDSLAATVRDYLSDVGVNLDGVQPAPVHCRTSLAVTEMKPSDGEVVLYRNGAADLSLDPDAISQEYIASAQCLLISGTALSASPSREATLLAMKYAKAVGTRVVLDIDFRAYSWESSSIASLYCQIAVGLADIVIGNQEEMEVLMKFRDQRQECDFIEAIFALGNTEIIVVKKGEQGSQTYCRSDKDIVPIEQPIFPVDVVKPFGAGDAFAGALLFGLIQNYSLPESLEFGAAAAAMNVAQDNCADAMPDFSQLHDFIQGFK